MSVLLQEIVVLSGSFGHCKAQSVNNAQDRNGMRTVNSRMKLSPVVLLSFLLAQNAFAKSLLCASCIKACLNKFGPIVDDPECAEYCIDMGMCEPSSISIPVSPSPSPIPLSMGDLSNETIHSFQTSSKTVALVLSGGGSWGAMQAGFLRAICESGMVHTLGGFDLIVGTSIGAYNTAMLAQFNKAEFCQEVLLLFCLCLFCFVLFC